MAKKLTLKDVELKGKRVLVRVDFNVPLDKTTGEVTDDTRIVAAIPTIEYITEKGGKAILVSHLGRPKGGKDPKYTLKNVTFRLEKLIGKPVKFVGDCIGPEVEKAVFRYERWRDTASGKCEILSREEKNNPEFAAKLAAFAIFMSTMPLGRPTEAMLPT